MNEQELERRFRSVTDEPQPYAPPSLRRFLHELPETAPVRLPLHRRIWSSIAGPAPLRRVGTVAALASAVVIAAVGANMINGMRTPGPMTSGKPTVEPTPQSTTVQIEAGGIEWRGLPDYAGPMPTSAVPAPRGYLGVGGGKLLASADGLHWTPVEASKVDPRPVDLYSIARGPAGYVLVGGAKVADGTKAHFYLSTDGETWAPAPELNDMNGAPARLVVAGKGGYLVAAWNDGDENKDNTLTRVWMSANGWNWQRTYPGVRGTTWAMAEGDSFVISGYPLPLANHDYLLYSWADSMWGGMSLDSSITYDKMRPVLGGTVLADGRPCILLSFDNGKSTKVLVWTMMDKTGWWQDAMAKLDTGETNPPFASIATVGKVTIAARPNGSGTLYVSSSLDAWTAVSVKQGTVAPTGTAVIAVGDEVLVTGDTGIWIGR